MFAERLLNVLLRDMVFKLVLNVYWPIQCLFDAFMLLFWTKETEIWKCCWMCCWPMLACKLNFFNVLLRNRGSKIVCVAAKHKKHFFQSKHSAKIIKMHHFFSNKVFPSTNTHQMWFNITNVHLYCNYFKNFL